MNLLKRIAKNFSNDIDIVEEKVEVKEEPKTLSNEPKIDEGKLSKGPLTGAFIANSFNKYKSELLSLLKENLSGKITYNEGKLSLTTDSNIDEISFIETLAKMNQEKWRGLGAALFFNELMMNYEFDSSKNSFTFPWIVTSE
jgi:hypothetical protein